jgi:UDP:flavonoid glycosyltransferase YjiC (YdhE family)
MELAAARTPFLYFPLRGHFEQNLHVRHRLERYGAGRPMSFEDATPQAIGEAIADALAETPSPADVERDGAARAAQLMATLL